MDIADLYVRTGGRSFLFFCRAVGPILAVLMLGACTAGTGQYASSSESPTTTTTPPGSSVQTNPASDPAPTLSLVATPSSVTSGSSATLSWSSTNATSCTASGAWSGGRPTSSNGQTVGPLLATGTYTLTCSGAGGVASQSVTVAVAAAPANGSATLMWTPPTTNVDGTSLSLAGFNVYSGTSPSTLTRTASVGWSTTLYNVTGLPTGTFYFAVTAVSTTGAESSFSNIGSKTIN